MKKNFEPLFVRPKIVARQRVIRFLGGNIRDTGNGCLLLNKINFYLLLSRNYSTSVMEEFRFVAFEIKSTPEEWLKLVDRVPP